MLKFCKQFSRLIITSVFLFCGSIAQNAFAQLLNPSSQFIGEQISEIKIVGNQTVTTAGIMNIMSIKPGIVLTPQLISNDIKSIFAMGYFQDVKINKSKEGEITVEVKEKPTINDIVYIGFEAVKSTSLKDKIVSKKYTIVDEKKISQDLRAIEQAYIEKGYYLSKASYSLEESQPGIVNIVYKIKENIPISVRSVHLIGNSEFSDFELNSFMGTKPFSWMSFFSSSGLFKDEYGLGDQQNLIFFHRDNGYAEATAAAPIVLISKDRTNLDISYYIEQGEKFNIGTISFTGDVITTESQLKESLTLKEGDLYRISKFNNDMKKLQIYYGDYGYAFAYVYPKFSIDRKKRIYNITYNITKGAKSYFRNIIISGNLKTRDNVIRRALKISEGQLFNSTNIEKSKAAINQLGFFDNNVILNQEPDKENGVVDIRIALKEKSTGQLTASIGASPNSNNGSGITFFGSFQYQEKNFLGRAYGLGANIQLSPSPSNSSDFNYLLGFNFTNPSVFDGLWSYSLNLNYQKQVSRVSNSVSVNQVFITQNILSTGIFVGREIFENFRITGGYSLSRFNSDPSVPLTSKFYQSGRTEEISQSATYDVTDNYLNPTEGLFFSVSNAVGFKFFAGQYNYGLVSSNISYYVPITFAEGYKTNFKFMFMPKYVYETRSDIAVPIWKRLSLGNVYQMKGYTNAGEMITSTVQIPISPITGQTIPMIYGGTKSYYGSAEYFIPIVPEAGLRFVAFGEAGTVLSEGDSLVVDNVKYDIGFGFRWMTPVAPFRFEWAFPVQNNGRLGPAHFVFTIGYDSYGSGS